MKKIAPAVITVIVFILNMFIAIAITKHFNIYNVILLQSYTATNYTITYEVLIWFGLSLLEAPLLDYLKTKKEATDN